MKCYIFKLVLADNMIFLKLNLIKGWRDALSIAFTKKINLNSYSFLVEANEYLRLK